MRFAFPARVSAVVIAVVFATTLITPVFAFSVSVGDISNQDDVEDLRDEVEDELDDAVQDLQDDCDRGMQLDLNDEEDNLVEDIQDIYDDARDNASSSFDDELDDDEDDLINDAQDEIDALDSRGCDNRMGTMSNRNMMGSNFFSPFFGGFNGFNAGARVTTVTPLYNNFFSPNFGQSFNGGCSGAYWNSGSCGSSFGGNYFGGSMGGNTFGSMYNWGY